MLSSPDAVVVCAWYNRSEYIEATVCSLLSQTYKSYEIVIVNDGSTDPLVKTILDSYTDPRLRVIHQENTGFLGAIQRAIAESTAPYIVMQGSADLSHPERLQKQIDVLKSRQDVVAVGSRLENILDVRTGRMKTYGTPADGDLSGDALSRIIMMHGEVAYRRSAYDDVGGYRSFFAFSQDRDLWCRFSRIGKIVVLDDILYTRLANIGGVSGDPSKQLIQRFLSHFSIYCHGKVLRGERDPLEAFGPQAALLYGGTFALQADLLRLASRFVLADSPQAAQEILKSARSTKYGSVAKFAAWFLREFPRASKAALGWMRRDSASG